ncbi:SPFH domain-containing protein [Candidatus Halobeggiatoa sp. HSG11]|nr:SPFH domain-containing protein [Candidatus Halobeggiatoa sp. HSG11]
MFTYYIVVAVIIGLFIIGFFSIFVGRYKTCPSNKILVKYGKIGAGKSALPIHGGAAFVWPFIQQYSYLDLTPITTDVPLKSALSKQNIRVNVPSKFTFGIGTTEELMHNASIRILGLTPDALEAMAQEIILGQLRATIATMNIEEINADRDTFSQKVMENIESELKKIGLRLINVNIADITDESGYLKALGEKAAAEAINRAKVQVAQQQRDGETGSANAKQEERVNVADANARAITGENKAMVVEANSNADRREAEADAKRRGDSAEAVQTAAAQEAGYVAEQQAEVARAERERATQQADVVVPAEIAKDKQIIDAEAKKAQMVLDGQGKGEALKAEMSGQAKGIYEQMAKKADGFKAIVAAIGGDPDKAATLMVIEQLPKIVDAQSKAISNIKFDKIVVMDTANGDHSTTANWISSITKILPPLHEFANMSGVELPETLGKILKPKTDSDISNADKD